MKDNKPITIAHIREMMQFTKLLKKEQAQGIFVGIVIAVHIVNERSILDAIEDVTVAAEPDFEDSIPEEWKR